MALSVFSAFVVGVLVILDGVQVGFSAGEDYAKNYISWDDMKVGDHKAGLNTRDEYEGSRVIVVDQNGGGDSFTVQGAVDMVPEQNTKRVKIYIHPGIYR
jgi:pectinesterase